MKSKLINVLVFAAGAAIGSAVTWKVLKTKYDRIVQEEIESIKDAFSDLPPVEKKQDEDKSEDEDARPHANVTVKQINWEELEDLDEEEFSDDDRSEYTILARGYNADMPDCERPAKNYYDEKGGAEAMAKDGATKPYVIAPYDFGELDGYEQVELTYYEGDDTLEDEEYNIITNRNELIGSDSLFTFGEYEDDAVFVRNDELRTDFQILKDYRSYKEARSVAPSQVDDE